MMTPSEKSTRFGVLMKKALPTAPRDMTDSHLANAVRFHSDKRERNPQMIEYYQRCVEDRELHGQVIEAALAACVEEQQRRVRVHESEQAVAKEAFARQLARNFPAMTPVCSSAEAELRARIALLELSNFALAEKVSQLSRRRLAKVHHALRGRKK